MKFFEIYKYCPGYPGYFDSLEDARWWTLDFVNWYNCQHRHCGIKFVTPEQKHDRGENSILSKREQTYEQARAKHLERWTEKNRNWSPIEVVHLNPAPSKPKTPVAMAA